MNKKYYYIIGAILALLTAFAFGYYVKPDKVVTKTITVEVERKQENTKDKSIIVEVIKPDGTRTITTKKDTETVIVTKREEKQNTETTTIKKSSTLLLSVMGGVDVFNPSGIIVGGHVSKQLFGPIHIGLFGLSNGSAGASVGLQF